MAKRGRPAFKPTPALRRQVQELTSCGMSLDDIARALGCHSDTVAKHFDNELRSGRAVKRAEVVKLLFKTARAGNVSAQRKLEEMTGMTEAAAQFFAPAKEKPLGKKEQATAEAESAGEGTPFEGLVKLH